MLHSSIDILSREAICSLTYFFYFGGGEESDRKEMLLKNHLNNIHIYLQNNTISIGYKQ